LASKSGYRAGAILAVFLFIVAASFTGKFEPISYSEECTDGSDNDGDVGAVEGGIDPEDLSCFVYPFSDGNGETDTPQNERYTSMQDYPSLFEYHRDYGSFSEVCTGYGDGWYDATPEDKAEADIWLNAQGIPRLNCPP
jgi:hypothetical protein